MYTQVSGRAEVSSTAAEQTEAQRVTCRIALCIMR